MQLSVIILNYNVKFFLELCLQSVTKATASIDAEIIVVDNNSQDDSCDMVRQKFPDVLLLENKTNPGFSKGNNIGVSQAIGEYVCILNPDTVVAEDTFSLLLNFATKQKNLGIIGCKLVDGSGQFLPESKRNIPTPLVSIKKIIGNSKSYYANHLNADAIGKTDVFVGAFMLLKRSVYNSVNGFDEDYFMYGEDVDLSYRIVKSGLDNYYFGETTVLHFKGESTLKDQRYAKRFYGAMQIFYKKHFKKHILFDTLVWLGIKFAHLFNKTPIIKDLIVTQQILVSYSSNDKLAAVLKTPFIVVKEIPANVKNCELIFDANMSSYKHIIKEMQNLKKVKGIKFKILPENSNFIIGSHHSKSRGEVITF